MYYVNIYFLQKGSALSLITKHNAIEQKKVTLKTTEER